MADAEAHRAVVERQLASRARAMEQLRASRRAELESDTAVLRVIQRDPGADLKRVEARLGESVDRLSGLAHSGRWRHVGRRGVGGGVESEFDDSA